MLTCIHIQHPEYPKRQDFNNQLYHNYKFLRPYFFHKNIFNQYWSETLTPTIEDYRDKFTYITNDYLLNSIFFEYCDYYVNNSYYNNQQEINTNGDTGDTGDTGNEGNEGNGNDYELLSGLLPINPYGPTGIGGRGLLGKWGPNHAADPIITTFCFDKNVYQLLAIERRDMPGIWALPGGMQDTNEIISQTVIRELKEETNVILNIQNSKFIYAGYVNDPRNTDHAWLETCVYHFDLNETQRETLLKTMKAGDDAKSVKLIDICDTCTEYVNMYANHKDFVDFALQQIIEPYV
jgi:ADP-ribose pyrophosphatase YjhB (NUDIX family)